MGHVLSDANYPPEQARYQTVAGSFSAALDVLEEEGEAGARNDLTCLKVTTLALGATTPESPEKNA